MDLEKLQEYLLQKTGTDESFPFGPTALVFKVGGKMFALVSLESIPLQMNVKCDPEKAIELREEHNAVIPGYHMSKKHWNTIIFDGTVSEDFVKTWVDHSYDCVVSGMTKKAQRELAARGENEMTTALDYDPSDEVIDFSNATKAGEVATDKYRKMGVPVTVVASLDTFAYFEKIAKEEGVTAEQIMTRYLNAFAKKNSK